MTEHPVNTDAVDGVAVALHVATDLPKDDPRVQAAAWRVITVFRAEIAALKEQR